MGLTMGDSFNVVPRLCATDCGQTVVFIVDAASADPRTGERARARCPRCGRINVLTMDGTSVVVVGDDQPERR